MNLKLLEQKDYFLWDEFVSSSPQANIYYKSWYVDLYNKPFDIYVLFENDQIQSGVILIKNEIGVYSNPLLLKYLGIIYKNYCASEYKIESFKRRCNEKLMPILNQSTFSYNFHPSVQNHLSFYWKKNMEAKVQYTYIIDLEKELKEIESNMNSKLKNSIKSSHKRGYLLDFNLDFNDFFPVIEKTFQRQGGESPFKKEFLQNFVNKLKEKEAIKLIGIKSGDNLMAVAGIIYDESCCSLILNGYDNELIERDANERLIYECIHFAKQQKSKIFDFEGSMIHSIDSFYRKFGGTHTSYLKIYKNTLFNFGLEKLRAFYKKIKYGK